MFKYQPTIGLEVHARLNTETKMFCFCKNDSSEIEPNVNVCPVCLAHPGTLPVINKKAVLSVIKIGLALGGNIAKETNFDRKSYFYPDLPKGFQISQFDDPLVSGGELKGINITRVHLEEDAGSLVHLGGNSSLIDYNRAGTPLAELVTEPEMRSADNVIEFAKELQLILRYLGVSSANMEKGEMRVEANVSLNMGNKVELKNINSFKAVRQAIEYEIKRQRELLEKGERVAQETRGWDKKAQKTIFQRSKEESNDYRYFPEPDLPPLDLDNLDIENIKNNLPELPQGKRERFIKEYGLGEEHVENLVKSKQEAEYFEEAVTELKMFDSGTDINVLFHYFTGELRGLINDKKLDFSDLKIKPKDFAYFINLILKNKLSSRLAKDMFLEMFNTGKAPEIIKDEGDFEVIGGENELKVFANEVIKENEEAVSDYKNGKKEIIKFLVGQVMKKSKGQADPKKVSEVLKEILSD